MRSRPPNSSDSESGNVHTSNLPDRSKASGRHFSTAKLWGERAAVVVLVWFTYMQIMTPVILKEIGVQGKGGEQMERSPKQQDRLDAEQRARLEQEIFCEYSETFGLHSSMGEVRRVQFKAPLNANSGSTYPMEVYKTGDIVSNEIKRGGWDDGKVDAIARAITAYSAKHNVSLSELTFVDIGANVGWFTVKMAALGVQVVAFEPMASNLYLLRRTLCLEENAQLAERILLFGRGLGKEAQTCVVYSDDNNRGDGHTTCSTSNIDQVLPPKGYSVRGAIKVERLDDILSLENRRVVAVKMDTEGFEANVVEGGPEFFLNSKIPSVFTEYSPLQMMKDKGGNGTEFMRKFLDSGYHVLNNGKQLSREHALDVNNFPNIQDVVFELDE
jgi:FkbM family methyltransferase